MSMDEACTITTEDTTIASLKTLIADLSRQVAGLTSRIDDLKIVAHDALSSKNRVSALAALRSKNLAASTLSQRSETLTQLEEIYAKIEQAADQVEIVRVMQASAGVLKSSNSQTGGVEKVEDVVEELRSEMSMVDVVGNAIVGIGQDEAMLDEGEIDDELKIMEEEQRSEKETQEAAETQRRLDELTTAARMDDGRSAKSANVSEAPHTEAKVLESAASPGPVSPEESRALWENDERKQSPAEQHTGDRLQTA